MSKKELAIGVLGAGGNIGHTHSQNIATYVDGARLAAVYDLNTERAEEVAKTYGAKVMASAEELIASPEIDAPCYLHPGHGTHADLAAKVHRKPASRYSARSRWLPRSRMQRRS